MVPLRAVVLVILATTMSLTSASYMLLAPKQIRPGLEYQAALQYTGTGAVQVEMKITESNVDVVSQTKTQVSGSFEIYTLLIPETITTAKTYVLEVTGRQGGAVIFKNSTTLAKFQLIPSMKTSMLFIQTDKGIYQPGSTIKFRVLSVTPDLLPNPETFDVSVIDPTGNKIRVWAATTLNETMPVFTGEHALADRVQFGDWKIEVATESEIEMVTVKVERYVLPRFSVKLSMPPVMLFEDAQIDGEVKALYSYGKDVKGMVEITLGKKSQSQPQPEPAMLKKVEPMPQPTNSKSITKAIDGIASFSFTFTDAELKKWGCNTQYSFRCVLDLTAEVTEDLSGTSQSEEMQVTLYKHREKITFINPSTLLKPGLTYKGTISITQQDGSPLTSVQGDLSVQVTFPTPYACQRCGRYDNSGRIAPAPIKPDGPVEVSITLPTAPPPVCLQYYTSTCYNNTGPSVNLTIPPNGIVSYEFDVPDTATRATITAQYMNIKQETHSVNSRFESGNNKSLELKSLTSSPVVGVYMDFSLRPSAPVDQAFVLVASKGKIVYTDIVLLTSGETTFSIMATADMAPMCTVIAYFVESDEVIADSVGLRVSGIFRNEVTTSFSMPTQDVGKSVGLTVRAEPQSNVYILAIDKTVLQLADANDITEEMVEDELGAFGMKTGSGREPIPCNCGGPEVMFRRKKRSIMPPWYPSFPGNTDKLLKDAGLIYLTDINVFKEQVYILEERGPDFPAPVPVFNPGTDDTAGGAPTDTTTTSVRTEFPETWIWTDTQTGSDGTVNLDVTLPDTITTWIATAFAVNPTAGLGIADIPAEVIGFRQFFIYPNLPVSLVRGESLDLDVSVFNYLPVGTVAQAVVTLAELPEWYSITGSNMQTVTVPNNGAATVQFKLVPRKHGNMPITIAAVSGTGASDAVVRNIRVFPEGKQVTGCKNFLLKVTPANSPLLASHSIVMPEFIVTDSKYIKVTVTGNVMGPSIEGLEKLVQRPVGCGEQNIITLVPNIYVRDLMEATNKITPELAQRTTKHMNDGVQRELYFQRTDGSFSAFRPSNGDSGSTWLTAFVGQSFQEARQFVTIDQQILDKALSFIIMFQQPNGTFTEPGRVIHKDMQGGTSNGMTMAAYMLITMVMTRSDSAVDLTGAISKTQTLLETEVTSATDDPYLLAITAYALQLADSPHAASLVTKLNSIAINNGDGRHWEIPQPPTPSPSTRRYSHYSAGPSNVEMTSYVLKTYVLQNKLIDGAKVMKWLSEERNQNGGFYSTQDTVLALGAMTAFYKETYNSDNLNVVADITIDGNTQRKTITAANADVVQAYEAENPASNDVSIVTTGEGDIFVQVCWAYNVEGTVEIIDIEHDILPVAVPLGSRRKRAANDAVINMELCLTIAEEVQDMAICEIGHPSGHTANMGKLDRYVDDTEVTTKTVIYFKQLPANYSSCSEIQFIKETPVENVKPANSICYFYYKDGVGSTKRFTMTGDPPPPVPVVQAVPDTMTRTTPYPSTSTGAPPTPVTKFPVRFALMNMFLPFFAVSFLLGDQA